MKHRSEKFWCKFNKLCYFVTNGRSVNSTKTLIQMKAFVSIWRELNTESGDSIVQYWINNFGRIPA